MCHSRDHFYPTDPFASQKPTSSWKTQKRNEKFMQIYSALKVSSSNWIHSWTSTHSVHNPRRWGWGFPGEEKSRKKSERKKKFFSLPRHGANLCPPFRTICRSSSWGRRKFNWIWLSDNLWLGEWKSIRQPTFQANWGRIEFLLVWFSPFALFPFLWSNFGHKAKLIIFLWWNEENASHNSFGGF